MPTLPARCVILASILALSMLAISAAPGIAHAADDVTIYRCVGAGGKVSLQDHPCPKDARQDVRQMIRPQDPPPRPSQPIVQAPPAAPAPIEVHIVHQRDPQPLYECTTSNGETYLSQTGVPQARYVPLWTFGFGGGDFTNIGPRTSMRRTPEASRTFTPSRTGPIFFPPSVYVEDRCERLPQVEVCQRLRDRQDELGTRIFNAQPSDRARFESERQGLIEQMRSDCGAW